MKDEGTASSTGWDEDKTVEQDDWPQEGIGEPLFDGVPTMDFTQDPVHFEIRRSDTPQRFRRKSRKIWFVSGEHGLAAADTWEELVYSKDTLSDFVDKYKAAYYTGNTPLGDENDPAFYYLMQGDVIIGRAKSSAASTEADMDVVAIVGEIEDNVRGKVQDPVPGAMTFSLEMSPTPGFESRDTTHVLTFLTEPRICYECEDVENPLVEICDPTNTSTLAGSSSGPWVTDSECGVSLCVITKVKPNIGYYCDCDGDGLDIELDHCFVTDLRVTHRELFFDKCGKLMEVGSPVTVTLKPDCYE